MFGDLLTQEEDSIENVPEFSAQDLKEMEPDRMLEFDAQGNYMILQITKQFAIQLKACEQIVVACYNVSDHVPTFTTDEQSKLWKTMVIPTLVDCLTQDLIARSVIAKSFAAIRNLAEVIRVCYGLVRSSKGSKRAIEIAQNRIKQAMKEIEKFATKAETLEDGAIKKFDKHSRELFEIIGKEAAKYVEDEAKYDAQLRKLYIEEQELLTNEIGQKQGEVERFAYLINAGEKQLPVIENQIKSIEENINEERAKRNEEIKNEAILKATAKADRKQRELEMEKEREKQLREREEERIEREKKRADDMKKKLDEMESERKVRDGEYRQQLNELDQLNMNLEKRKQDIPERILKTVPRRRSDSGFWGTGLFKSSWTETETIEVKNPDRENQIRYYDDIMKSRLARSHEIKQQQLQDEQNRQKSEQDNLKFQQELLMKESESVKNELKIQRQEMNDERMNNELKQEQIDSQIEIERRNRELQVANLMKEKEKVQLEAIKQVYKELVDNIGDYKLKHKKAMKDLKQMQEGVDKRQKLIQSNIDRLQALKDETMKNADEAYKQVGLRGESLKTLLFHISEFKESIKTGVSAYQPLALILESIRTKVAPHVDLLDTESRNDIFLAGINLMKEVEFLKTYSFNAFEIMKPEYNAVEMENKAKAIQ